MADISKITLPSNSTYDIKDATARSELSNKQDKITPITAQATQAVYPIKIDAQGHITAYGSAVTINDIRKAFYGTCSTAAATAEKVVTLSDTNGWSLITGVIVGVKFTYSNTASSVKLNVNGTGAKSIYYNNAVYTSESNSITGYANRTNYYMYDGTYWVFISNGIIDSNTRYDADAVCATAAATSAKVASATGYVLRSNNRFTMRLTVANTSQSALTLNVNSTGAKTLYINGAVSSSSNYTLPAGDYYVYYDGTYYYVRTDDKIPGYVPATTSIGSASLGTAIAADDITAWTTNTPTAVTKKTVVTSATFNTVVTGGSTTSITPVTKKTVVTSASGATAAYANGVLTITNGSFGTGDSVTTGTAVNAYTSLTTGSSGSATTGDSVTVTAGTAASLSYTAKSIPNVSITNTTVATGSLSK